VIGACTDRGIRMHTGNRACGRCDDRSVAKTARTATVLFTDIVGSTELMARLGPEAAEEVRGRHFTAIRGALAVHRGNEVKTLGDGFMASFDSSGDALACAVTMQRAVTRENEIRGDGDLGMRIGVSAGEVTEEEGDYFGMPVVQASRLCDEAGPGQILASDVIRLLVGDGGIHRLRPIGNLVLKGVPEPVPACELDWEPDEQFALRVALAEDSALLRQGIAQVLEAEGFEVVLQAEDAGQLIEGLPAARPHVVVVDVRMPPTHTTEGLDAAEKIRSEYPETGVLVLSATVEAEAARRLLNGGTEGVGYMLKDRVSDIAELGAAIRTLASGGSVIDPNVIQRLAA
jgi:class 3 adenylate cyclase/ActR/RegA family two-component response regulator